MAERLPSHPLGAIVFPSRCLPATRPLGIPMASVRRPSGIRSGYE
jgi:hypothetical protein